MILIGLSILAAIALLVLIVWVLHRNQRKEKEKSVDRNLPLPPLDLKDAEVTQMSTLEDIFGITPEPAAPLSSAPEVVAAPSEQWLVNSREFLAIGKFDKALQECDSALPQMGAFRQACVVMRAQIRELKKQGQAYASALEQLYQLAAVADFFHGRTPGTRTLSTSALKQIDYASWKTLSSPYAVLGFQHLSLISKTDAKWLVQEWGEPDSHSLMRELHAAQWHNLYNSLQGKLV